MKKIEQVVTRKLEEWLSNRYVCRYGLAILVSLIPCIFWAAGVIRILVGAWDISLGKFTREWVNIECQVLTMVLIVYIAIWSLEWRDKKKKGVGSTPGDDQRG